MFSNELKQRTSKHPLHVEWTVVCDVTARAAAWFVEHGDDCESFEGLGEILLLSKVNTLAINLFSLVPTASAIHTVGLKRKSKIPYRVHLLNVHLKIELASAWLRCTFPLVFFSNLTDELREVHRLAQGEPPSWLGPLLFSLRRKLTRTWYHKESCPINRD